MPNHLRAPARAASLLCAALVAAASAAAQDSDTLYRCHADNGRSLFSDTPCERHGAHQTGREEIARSARPVTAMPVRPAAALPAVMGSRLPQQDNAGAAATARAVVATPAAISN